METIKLRDGFYWTGIIDDKLRVFDIVMYTEFGTTYNSYVMKTGNKVVLFETAKARFFDEYLEMTNSPSAPWYVVNAKSRKWAELQVLETLTEGIDIAMQNKSLAVPLLQNVFPLVKMPKLEEIPFSVACTNDELVENNETYQEIVESQLKKGDEH